MDKKKNNEFKKDDYSFIDKNFNKIIKDDYSFIEEK